MFYKWKSALRSSSHLPRPMANRRLAEDMPAPKNGRAASMGRSRQAMAGETPSFTIVIAVRFASMPSSMILVPDRRRQNQIAQQYDRHRKKRDSDDPDEHVPPLIASRFEHRSGGPDRGFRASWTVGDEISVNSESQKAPFNGWWCAAYLLRQSFRTGKLQNLANSQISRNCPD